MTRRRSASPRRWGSNRTSAASARASSSSSSRPSVRSTGASGRAAPGSPIAPPWPDIALAAGRRALPYLKRLKRASGRAVFTVYVNRPVTGRAAADLIVSPLHDGFFGPNVVTPITPANRASPELLARLRREPDPRVASLAQAARGAARRRRQPPFQIHAARRDGPAGGRTRSVRGGVRRDGHRLAAHAGRDRRGAANGARRGAAAGCGTGRGKILISPCSPRPTSSSCPRTASA